MARKILTRWIDDLDGSEAAETVGFGLDAVGYELDLSAQHAAELRAALAEFTVAARRISGRAADRRLVGTRTRRPAVSDVEREQLRQIRVWARANGFPVADRGRISREIRDAFAATPAEVRGEQARTLSQLTQTSPVDAAPARLRAVAKKAGTTKAAAQRPAAKKRPARKSGAAQAPNDSMDPGRAK